MKNKGFTLIELLAVIVIIGIIAIITIPKINDQVEESKKNTARSSATNLKKTINEYVLHENMNKNNLELNGEYNIDENGKLYNEDGIYNISYEGKKPKNGVLNYVNNDLTTACITIDKYKITFENGEITNTEKGTCTYTPISKELFGTIEEDGAKYITDPMIIYLNPDDLDEQCTAQNSSSTVGTHTGCMKWYLYSTKGEYGNLLLDHNITSEAIDWITQTDYESATEAETEGISFPETITEFPDYNLTFGTNHKGPITTLKTLKSLTSTWETSTPKVPNSSSSNEHIVPATRNDNKYAIDYTDYNARLLTKQESNYLGCSEAANSCPEWMIANLSGDTAGTFGYWTSSRDPETDYFGLAVHKNRNLNYDASYGIRPVITVELEDIL